jgi:hypothetical protein
MRSERRLALAVVLALAAAPLAAGEVLERVLADLDGQPVLLSEVRLYEELKGLSRERALEAVIDARLMHREAARLPQASLARDEADRACADLRGKAPQLDEDSGICVLARREAVILKYVAFRFTGQDVDGQIEAWVEELRAAAAIRYNAP